MMIGLKIYFCMAASLLPVLVEGLGCCYNEECVSINKWLVGDTMKCFCRAEADWGDCKNHCLISSGDSTSEDGEEKTHLIVDGEWAYLPNENAECKCQDGEWKNCNAQCRHAFKTYDHGETATIDSKSCTCTTGKWVCNDPTTTTTNVPPIIDDGEDDESFCSGTAGFQCDDDLVCVDNLLDDCNPDDGDIGCPGICEPKNKGCEDQCPDDPFKTTPGACGCGHSDVDTDFDGVPDCLDKCPEDDLKLEPGACGCGSTSNEDSDNDGVPDCLDKCPNDALKLEPGACGCGAVDTYEDSDKDNVLDCNDVCPEDPNKSIDSGICGCGFPEIDRDNDGYIDCGVDDCPEDVLKIKPGMCGCGTPDSDADGDGVMDCIDVCPLDPNDNCCKNDNGDIVSEKDWAYFKDKDKWCQCKNSKWKDCKLPCDYLGEDSDGDGQSDCVDVCPFDNDDHCCVYKGIIYDHKDWNYFSNNNKYCQCRNQKWKNCRDVCDYAGPDSDGDGIGDCADICPYDEDDKCCEFNGNYYNHKEWRYFKRSDEYCQCKDNQWKNCKLPCDYNGPDADNDGIGDCVDECTYDSKNRCCEHAGDYYDHKEWVYFDYKDKYCQCKENKFKNCKKPCAYHGVDSDGDGVSDCEDKCPHDKKNRCCEINEKIFDHKEWGYVENKKSECQCQKGKWKNCGEKPVVQKCISGNDVEYDHDVWVFVTSKDTFCRCIHGVWKECETPATTIVQPTQQPGQCMNDGDVLNEGTWKTISGGSGNKLCECVGGKWSNCKENCIYKDRTYKHSDFTSIDTQNDQWCKCVNGIWDKCKANCLVEDVKYYHGQFASIPWKNDKECECKNGNWVKCNKKDGNSRLRS